MLTAANLVRAGTARGTFLGVNTDLGTAANQVKFTGLANNLTLPCATVVGGSGTQATVLKGSLAEVTAPTDVVRLTRSEVINTAITVAGLEFAGDGMPP
ncbi:MAG: hypothetical protein K2P78_02935 [Gemmataceae bacterium]|nr:hypothetical protein [Gemmataceae bacterium]